jgi:hypothetical protein
VKTITKYDYIETGAFVKRYPVASSLPENSRILLTYNGKKEIKEYILNSIKHAKKYIKLCSFIITDEEIVHALMQRAKHYDLAIFILTQLDDRNITDSFLTDEELSNTSGKDHLTNLGKLNKVGVHIRAASDIHAKFLIVDGMESLITSANITDTSMNSIPESGVIVTDERSKELEKIFDLIYKEGAPFRNFAADSKGNQSILQTSLNEIKYEILPTGSSGFSYTYRSQVKKLYEDIVLAVQSAKSDVYISTYSIKELARLPEFVSAIKTALERGIGIHIFCRAMNYRTDHLNACKELNSLGCHIRGDVFNHAKGVVNKELGLIFTANIDGEYGLTNGFEIGTALVGKERDDLLVLSKYLFDTAPFGYEENPKIENVFGYFQATYEAKRVRNILIFDELVLKIELGSDFNPENLEKHFLYGVIEDNQIIGVELGNEIFKASLDRANNEITIGTKTKYLSSSVKFIIQFETLNIDYAKS